MNVRTCVYVHLHTYSYTGLSCPHVNWNESQFVHVQVQWTCSWRTVLMVGRGLLPFFLRTIRSPWAHLRQTHGLLVQCTCVPGLSFQRALLLCLRWLRKSWRHCGGEGVVFQRLWPHHCCKTLNLSSHSCPNGLYICDSYVLALFNARTIVHVPYMWLRVWCASTICDEHVIHNYVYTWVCIMHNGLCTLLSHHREVLRGWSGRPTDPSTSTESDTRVWWGQRGR